ncbi:MAG TPA: YbgC/FadM family acyl-CoA thioesterase [Polyangiaceae bacterium]|jgi:tol-pal system-associated acyl-CoA thioesterase|nr:MAG: Acyl-CoA thioester hydrolase YbgC [Deltaproteobacteria bacterium ADurb.Bin207]HNS99123.1 YbgC/FadM family acyl-CoA thioesterase [Polyangiaceae bacterium]HNZ24196.1 YbgC/FadM family acyl-CoA thioesterase [Polyangiaceae bacterium]HOD22553.1 YbgC/FadM family acyl-CoA thioesterase [Polyangiaceae bacterium]HOE49451.1 YbgC/FadM family acyl-CoA thioesterase [Polyangiaceae bacterium]
MEQQLDVKVYYEDTDCMGVVYHANYLRFLERARTELLNSLGPSIREWTDRGVIFPIYSVQITFKAPARLGDTLRVYTRAKKTSPFRVTFDQRIERPEDGKLLIEAKVEAVCTDLQGRLREYPDIGLQHGS